MEKVSDFFSELKERISNPFILSYIVGWCLWNYEIVIALIFYKIDDLKKDGYKSYLDLILRHQSTWNFFWLPFISAITYTFIFPFVKNGILAFGVWIDSWGGELNRKISRAKTVDIQRFLEQEEKYNLALTKVSKYVSAGTEIDSKLAELNIQLQESERQRNRDLQSFELELEKLRQQILGEEQLNEDFDKKILSEKLKFSRLNQIWAKRQTTSIISGKWRLIVYLIGQTSLLEISNVLIKKMSIEIERNGIIKVYILLFRLLVILQPFHYFLTS